MSPDKATSKTVSSATGSVLRVTQVRSEVSTKPKHRATLRAMGLRGVGRSRVHADSPSLRGMLARVSHLIQVEPAEQGELVRRLKHSEARAARAAAKAEKAKKAPKAAKARTSKAARARKEGSE